MGGGIGCGGGTAGGGIGIGGAQGGGTFYVQTKNNNVSVVINVKLKSNSLFAPDCGIIHLLTCHSLIRSLARSLTHSLTHSITHSLTHSLTQINEQTNKQVSFYMLSAKTQQEQDTQYIMKDTIIIF